MFCCGVCVYLLRSTEGQGKGGEEGGQSFGDESGDEEQEVLGGTDRMGEGQRPQGAHQPTDTPTETSREPHPLRRQQSHAHLDVKRAMPTETSTEPRPLRRQESHAH